MFAYLWKIKTFKFSFVAKSTYNQVCFVEMKVKSMLILYNENN